MKRGRQEEIIKQKEDIYTEEWEGWNEEGKMTYLGCAAWSGILHPRAPAHVHTHTHTLQFPREVNPPAFPHDVLSQPSHFCNLCACVCVCMSPLLF